MGTLFDQPPRNYLEVSEAAVDSFLESVRLLSEKYVIPVRDVIAAFDVLERRRENDLRVSNSDILDEQFAGLGAIFQQLVDALDAKKDEMDGIARAIDRLGTGNAATPMGAIEFLATKLDEGAQHVAEALSELVSAVQEAE